MEKKKPKMSRDVSIQIRIHFITGTRTMLRPEFGLKWQLPLKNKNKYSVCVFSKIKPSNLNFIRAGIRIWIRVGIDPY